MGQVPRDKFVEYMGTPFERWSPEEQRSYMEELREAERVGMEVYRNTPMERWDGYRLEKEYQRTAMTLEMGERFRTLLREQQVACSARITELEDKLRQIHRLVECEE